MASSDDTTTDTPASADTTSSSSSGTANTGFMQALGAGLTAMGNTLGGVSAPAAKQKTGTQSAGKNIKALAAADGGAASMPTTDAPEMDWSGAPPQQPDMSSSSSGGMNAGQAAGAVSSIMSMSDKKAKKNIKNVDDDQVNQFVNSLSPKSYDYKDKSNGGDAAGHVAAGMMAQDLQRSQLGSSAVSETPKGKMVDTTKLTMMMAPVFATKIKALEDKLEQALASKFKQGKK